MIGKGALRAAASRCVEADEGGGAEEAFGLSMLMMSMPPKGSALRPVPGGGGGLRGARDVPGRGPRGDMAERTSSMLFRGGRRFAVCWAEGDWKRDVRVAGPRATPLLPSTTALSRRRAMSRRSGSSSARRGGAVVRVREVLAAGRRAGSARLHAGDRRSGCDARSSGSAIRMRSMARCTDEMAEASSRTRDDRGRWAAADAGKPGVRLAGVVDSRATLRWTDSRASFVAD